MNKKRLFLMAATTLVGLLLAVTFSGCIAKAQAQTVTQNPAAGPKELIAPGQAGSAKVYFTSDISPTGLMAVYNALGKRRQAGWRSKSPQANHPTAIT